MMLGYKQSTVYNLLFSVCMLYLVRSDDVDETDTLDLFRIEGKVDLFTSGNKDWMSQTRVYVDGGEYIGYLRNDGSFSINGLPSGSYVVEVSHPNYIFDAARVDITAKGKMRARKVNYLQPSYVKNSQYPLVIAERMKAKYFQQREQWRLTDFLMNPMVLTMILPLLLIGVLPKMMNAADPDAQKEMQTQMKAINDKSSMPDISEMLVNFLGGGGGDSKKTGKKKRS